MGTMSDPDTRGRAGLPVREAMAIPSPEQIARDRRQATQARIGAPVHALIMGNPSGAPCLPYVYLGRDAQGRDHIGSVLGHGGTTVAVRHELQPGERPSLDESAAELYGTWHLATACDVTGPVTGEDSDG